MSKSFSSSESVDAFSFDKLKLKLCSSKSETKAKERSGGNTKSSQIQFHINPIQIKKDIKKTQSIDFSSCFLYNLLQGSKTPNIIERS